MHLNISITLFWMLGRFFKIIHNFFVVLIKPEIIQFNNERKRTVKEATEESECKCRHENTGSTPVDATEEGPSTFPSTSSTEARKRGNKH